MNSPKISVIVPVYKAEKYLHRCVDSLLAQTFQDYEILLIDDGSPDRSGEICDEYAKRDARIRVFHKENGGVSSARNTGLDNANGEWIAFVDSDDWVESDYLQIMIEPTANKSVEYVVSGIRYFFLHTKRYQTMFEYSDMIVDINNMPTAICDLRLLNNGCPVAKLYQKNIIRNNNLYFNIELSINEDHLFTIQYYNTVETVATVKSISYNYFFDFQTTSLTKKRHSSDEYIKIAQMMADEFERFILRFDKIERNFWMSSEYLFGLQQIIKAIDNSIYSTNVKSTLVNVRDLLLQYDSIINCNKKRLQKLRFSLLLDQHYKLLAFLVYVQMNTHNLILNMKYCMKQAFMKF